jgi:hypothetical protein
MTDAPRRPRAFRIDAPGVHVATPEGDTPFGTRTLVTPSDEPAEIVDEGGDGAAIVGEEGGGDAAAQVFDPGEAEEADGLAHDDGDDGQEREAEEDDADPAEPGGARPKFRDQPIEREAEGEGDETADRGEQDRLPRKASRRGGGWDLDELVRLVAGGDDGAGSDRGGALLARHVDAGGVDAEGAGPAGRVGHVSRSPRRNSRVRSRRMCGSDRVKPSAVFSSRGGRKRTNSTSGSSSSDSDSARRSSAGESDLRGEVPDRESEFSFS